MGHVNDDTHELALRMSRETPWSYDDLRAWIDSERALGHTLAEIGDALDVALTVGAGLDFARRWLSSVRAAHSALKVDRPFLAEAIRRVRDHYLITPDEIDDEGVAGMYITRRLELALAVEDAKRQIVGTGRGRHARALVLRLAVFVARVSPGRGSVRRGSYVADIGNRGRRMLKRMRRP